MRRAGPPSPAAIVFGLVAFMLAGYGCQGNSGLASGGDLQLQRAQYRCGGGLTLIVERARQGVRVRHSHTGGDAIELPPAPPGQRSRFAVSSSVLVLDGRQALWMASGKRPLNCRR